MPRLYEAVGADPLSWWERLRLPFARPRSTHALIHRYGLWPALEFAYDTIVRELGPVRIREVRIDSAPDGFVYLTVEFLAQTTEIEPLLEFASALRGSVKQRFGSATSLRLSISIDPDPDYLPLFA